MRVIPGCPVEAGAGDDGWKLGKDLRPDKWQCYGRFSTVERNITIPSKISLQNAHPAVKEAGITCCAQASERSLGSHMGNWAETGTGRGGQSQRVETQCRVESKPGAVHLTHIQTEGATAAGQPAAAQHCHALLGHSPLRRLGKKSMSLHLPE